MQQQSYIRTILSIMYILWINQYGIEEINQSVGFS